MFNHFTLGCTFFKSILFLYPQTVVPNLYIELLAMSDIMS